jgi:hypothetical protein
MAVAAVTTAARASDGSDDDRYCRSLGAVPGSTAYVECRLTLRQEHERAVRRFFGALGAGLREAGRQMSAPPPVMPRQTYCNPNGVGGWYCTQY